MPGYCDVDGCRSSRVNNKELSFFQLPKQEHRRKKWLEVIGRPDLLTAKHTTHFVCSLHFDETQIKCKPQLLTDAVPMKLLPNQPNTSKTNTKGDRRDVSTQTKESYVNILSAVTIKGPDKKSSCAQTASENKNEPTQTSLALSTDTPRKRKLRDSLKSENQKRRKLERELNKIK
ncbi:unnamed protein product [Colias eurytheme]|nr:unnamed protein product [Colias eurytheme]